MGGTKDSAANPKTGLKWEFMVINWSWDITGYTPSNMDRAINSILTEPFTSSGIVSYLLYICFQLLAK